MLSVSKKHAVSAALSVVAFTVFAFSPVYLRRHEDDFGGLLVLFLVAVVAACVVCGRLRDQEWVVTFWLPFLLWPAIGCIWLLRALVQEVGGGPSAAPLAGSALLIGLMGSVLLALITLGAFLLKPNRWSVPYVILGLGCALIFPLVYRHADRAARAQDVTIRILDAWGSPVPDARVTFERFGYGARGTAVLDQSGGPIHSKSQGMLKIPSLRMRYRTVGMVSKPGYRDIKFDLGMQYNKWDRERLLTISTKTTEQIATLLVPCEEPLAVDLFLPNAVDESRVKEGLRSSRLVVRMDLESEGHPVLDFGRATMVRGPEGHVRIERFYVGVEGARKRPRLRFTGVNGTMLLQVPASFSKAYPATHDLTYRIAPLDGYVNETIVEEPGNHPGVTIYVRLPNGQGYARFTPQFRAGGYDSSDACVVDLVINAVGGRMLE